MIEKPNSQIAATVPTSATGIAIAGTSIGLGHADQSGGLAILVSSDVEGHADPVATNLIKLKADVIAMGDGSAQSLGRIDEAFVQIEKAMATGKIDLHKGSQGRTLDGRQSMDEWGFSDMLRIWSSCRSLSKRMPGG